MQAFVVAVFVATYLGMALGRIPGLRVDRTGIALLAAVALLAAGALPAERAAAAVDWPTLAILFALMILSAQFGLAGAYGWCAARIAGSPGSPMALLVLTVAVAGGLSALLANDVVVFAMTPILCLGVKARGLDPRPFLAALAGASNAGSAATLVGNPQNILIGQIGGLDFWRFLGVCGVPALFGLVCVLAAVAWTWRRELAVRPASAGAEAPPVDGWQLGKGLAATVALLILFATPLPREIAALSVAAMLLLSRRLATRTMVAAVDWHLLLLFAGLFLVNGALAGTGLPGQALAWAAEHDLMPDRLSVMGPLALAGSNTIGNVPAVIMLLALWPAPAEGALYGLAVLTTLAGNLLLVGSVANLIVAERAAAAGVRFGFADHARAGVPMALASTGAAVLWLGLGGWMPWR